MNARSVARVDSIAVIIILSVSAVSTEHLTVNPAETLEQVVGLF